MSKVLQTCETCKECTPKKFSRQETISFYYCKTTDLVVPHSSDIHGIVFHRVPLSCPRDDSEVNKQPPK